jgi:putative membrane protein insertion efficiency factor
MRIQCCLNCINKSSSSSISKPPVQLISMHRPHSSRIASASDNNETKRSSEANLTSEEEPSSSSPRPTVSLALASLQFYKSFISPLLPSVCRYQPSCSSYSVDAYTKFGIWKGTVLTAWRLLRCNPWAGSGYDPATWPPVGLNSIYASESEGPAQVTVTILLVLFYLTVQDLVYELSSL